MAASTSTRRPDLSDRRRSHADHAELMDGIYRYQRHIYDLTRKYYLLGRDRLIDGLDVPRGRHACSRSAAAPAAISCWRRRRYPDSAASSASTSRPRCSRPRGGTVAGAACRRASALAQGDATDFDAAALFGVSGFDRIFISYALSMIPDWQRTVDCRARRARRPAARCTSSISASRSACPAGSAAAARLARAIPRHAA